MFAAWRGIGFAIIALAQRFLPYAGFFPYGELLPEFRLPPLFYSLANFDGIHYLLIAKSGYSQYEQAFFPIYPLLTRAVSVVTGGNILVAALFLSNLSFLAGVLLFWRLANKELPVRNVSLWSLAFLFLFPTSFFAGAVYTEGLFFLLIIGFFLSLRNKRFATAALFACLASATRLIGIFLIIPLFIAVIRQKKFHRFTKGILLSIPFLGLISYMAYLWKTTGDPLFFIHAQPAFGAHRSSSVILLPQVVYRYLKIFVTAAPNYQYALSVAEFVFFFGVFSVVILDLVKNYRKPFRLGLGLFSFFNVLLPTLTGTFSSVPRYAWLSLSVYFYLAEIKKPWVRWFLAALFLVFHVIGLALFVRGYFVS